MSSVAIDRGLRRHQGGDRRRGGGRAHQEEARRLLLDLRRLHRPRRRPGDLRQPACRSPTPTWATTTACRTAGPSWSHWLGTDDLYRDILSRLIYGARVSLVVGFGGALLGLVIGGIPAMISAYRRGRVDTVLNTGSYVLLAFPAIVAVIAIVSFWGHCLWKITLIIGIFAAPLIFRVVRASTLSYATRDFVLAAKALGASDTRILTRGDPAQHHADGRVLRPDRGGHHHRAGRLAGLPRALGAAAHAELGQHAQRGASLLTGAKGQTNPWLVIFPATAMFLLLFSLNVVADKLRAYFDVTEIKL